MICSRNEGPSLKRLLWSEEVPLVAISLSLPFYLSVKLLSSSLPFTTSISIYGPVMLRFSLHAISV